MGINKLKLNSKNINAMLWFHLLFIPITALHVLFFVLNSVLIIIPRFIFGLPLGFLWTLNDVDAFTWLFNLIPIIGWAKGLIYIFFAAFRNVPTVVSAWDFIFHMLWYAVIINSQF